MKIHVYPYLILLCVINPLQALEDNFWLMLEIPADSSLYINTSLDKMGNQSLSMQLDQAINDKLHINSDWSQFTMTENLRQWSLGLSGDPYASWNWFYRYLNWGENNIIESRDHEVRLQYSLGAWNWLLGLQQGNVKLGFFRRLPNGQTSASLQHSAAISGLGYSSDRFYWQLEYIQHSYNRNLSPLASSRLLTTFIQPSALQQSTRLAERETSLSLGINIKDYTISSQYSRFTSAVSHSSSDFLNLSLQTPIGQKQTIGIQLNLPGSGANTSLGLSLLSQW